MEDKGTSCREAFSYYNDVSKIPKPELIGGSEF